MRVRWPRQATGAALRRASHPQGARLIPDESATDRSRFRSLRVQLRQLANNGNIDPLRLRGVASWVYGARESGSWQV